MTTRRTQLVACVSAAIIALCMVIVALAPPTHAAAKGSHRVGTGEPQTSFTLPEATTGACAIDPSGSACTAGVLRAIDAARAAEGVRPMRLPAAFGSLTPTQQLFVVTDLERVDRGLVAPVQLSSLDRRAFSGARNEVDPALTPMFGDAAGANLAVGLRSALEADFMWMYDDGPGSANADCRSAGQPGCWGHRDNILADYRAPLAMGAAVDARPSDGVSMTELFMGHDTRIQASNAAAP